jgi:hypothetical protein
MERVTKVSRKDAGKTSYRSTMVVGGLLQDPDAEV